MCAPALSGEDGDTHSDWRRLYAIPHVPIGLCDHEREFARQHAAEVMWHVSFTTTQRCISMANHVKAAGKTFRVLPALTKKTK